MIKGRFAPSPTGRMHLGNVFAALMSWLSVKSRGGKWVLRIEDLDPQRSRREYAMLLEDDLHWLGLDWDEGGLDAAGDAAPYCQSQRGAIYEAAFRQLESAGLLYPCCCTRSEMLSTQAPHQSDGRIVYPGRCRPERFGGRGIPAGREIRAIRLWVPDGTIRFNDRLYGPQSVNLASHCGDFVVRRGDGAWAYQLAVVVDDAAMGITEVVRGSDLLLSAAQQIYIYNVLGLTPPEFAHVPLLCNAAGQRLSKRDGALSMEVLRRKCSAEQVVGLAAEVAGLVKPGEGISPKELAGIFRWDALPAVESIAMDYGD